MWNLSCVTYDEWPNEDVGNERRKEIVISHRDPTLLGGRGVFALYNDSN